jgi:hypothetical protein
MNGEVGHSVKTAIAAGVGGLAGVALFVYVAGLRTIDPREIGWLMRWDWQHHYLGWLFFRHEAWTLPPGRILSLLAPLGTSIGYTDSIPLAALGLKPFSLMLPVDFQYFGLWLTGCFLFQGIFGALLVGVLRPSLGEHLVGVLILVSSPVLLNRVGHPALASHWLLLAGLWLYFAKGSFLGWWLLVATASLVHPYVAAMVLGIAGAAHLERFVEGGLAPARAALRLAILVLTCLAGWWTAGLLLEGAAPGSEGGVGFYSMNLLAPFGPMGTSAFLPDLPVATEGQYEGYNYLGVGVILLGIGAAVTLLRHPPSREIVRRTAPLAFVCGLFTLIAISPTVTFGRRTILALPDLSYGMLNVFRATGRFFWPANYLIVFGVIAALIGRYRDRTAVSILALGLAIQAADLSRVYANYRQVRGDPGWFALSMPLRDARWSELASRADHLTMVPPSLCGPPAGPEVPLALLAGRHGLTLNAGFASRLDLVAVARSCESQRRELASGLVRARTLYVVHDDLLGAFRAAAAGTVECAELDGQNACIKASMDVR